VGALTQAMREMLSDLGRLRAMGAAGRARAEQLLTWDRSAGRLEQILERGSYLA
jgi:glycosyltransferase involved in cell wall biosynthesis